MAGEALRSLYAEVGWKIDEAPLQKLDKLLDEIKKSMLGGSVEKFEKELDEANKTAKKLGESMEKVGDETKETERQTSRLGSAIKRVGVGFGTAYRELHKYTNGFERLRNVGMNTLNSLNRGIFGLARATIRAPFTLPGLLAGGVLAYGAGRLVGTSIGGAARLEMQQLQLEALLQDAEKARQLFEDMNRLGRVSVFSEEDFLEGAKTFLPLTRELDQINQLVRLQERLAASNPREGMEGAAFAIREALSGDTVSLVERFNVPRSMVENLRKATSLTRRIEELDKILTQLGFTQEYLTKVNESASAQWDNFKSNLSMGLGRAGNRALEELKPFLRDLNIFLGSDRAGRMFDRWGQALARAAREAANFGRWLIDRGGRAFDYIDRKYLSNKEFQKLPFNEKIDEVFSDIEAKITRWYNGGGKEKIEEGARNFIIFTKNVLEASAPQLMEVGKTLGKSIGSGLISGLGEAVKDHPILGGLAIAAVTPGPLYVKAAAGFGTFFGGTINKALENREEARKRESEETLEFLRKLENKPDDQPLPGWENTQLLAPPKKSIFPGFQSGLPYVPHDDFLARLHEGERVLTKSENKAYTRGQMMQGFGNYSPVVNITVNGGADAGLEKKVERAVRKALAQDRDSFWRSLRRNNQPILEV